MRAILEHQIACHPFTIIALPCLDFTAGFF